jgi:hypothetical protein
LTSRDDTIIEGMNECRIIGCKLLPLGRISETLIKGSASHNDAGSKTLDVSHFYSWGCLWNVHGRAHAKQIRRHRYSCAVVSR